MQTALSDQEDVSEQAPYWTPHHVRIAVTPTGIVLLDLKRNRYLGLGVTNARELAALAANWSQVSTEAQPVQALSRDSALARAAAFIQAGLLSRDAPEIAFTTSSVDLTVQLTSIGLQEQAATPVRLHDVMNFVRACLWAKWALRSRTLYSIACEISAAKAQASGAANLQRTIELVCTFRRLRPYAFESSDRCLFHALALLNFLARYGAHPTWVIGVCARPWAAHSWLQLGNCVLDSSPEEMCQFTPILAI
jgi:hypothetical protein